MGCGSSIQAREPQTTVNEHLNGTIPSSPNINKTTDKMLCAPAPALEDHNDQLAKDEKTEEHDENKKEQSDIKETEKKKQRLTPEEKKAKLKETLESLHDTTDYLSEQSIAHFNFLYFRFVSTTRNEDPSINKYGLQFGMIDICFKVWKCLYDGSDFLDPKDTLTFTVMKRVLAVMWNGSDRFVEICERLIELNVHMYALEVLQDEKIISNIHDEPEKGNVKAERQIYTMKGFIGILHNILHHLGDKAKNLLREIDTVNVLQKLLKSANTMIKTKAYINLAYLVNEDENELINADDRYIKFLIKILSDATNSANRFSRRYGFSTSETVVALNKLAVNDKNKEKIIDCGGLAVYEELLLGDIPESEKVEIARGLWILSFSPKCRKLLMDMPKTIASLNSFCHSDNPELKRYANGAVWTMGQMSKENERESQALAADTDCSHVMISYNWGVKPLALKMKERLEQAGFRTWMDVDNMTGSTLEAMADAVEKASVVLICMTEKYKESPSCRTEAEYTYQLRKPFIPLRFQAGYKADGWLGIMIGTKLWFDFVKNFDGAISGLIRELQRTGICGENSVKSAWADSPHVGLSTGGTPKAAHLKWTETEVLDWLKQAGLSACSKRLAGVDGTLLGEYNHMKHSAPEFFYSTLRNDLKLSLVDILKFTKALGSL